MKPALDTVRVAVGITLHRLADLIIGRRLLAAADAVYQPYGAPPIDYPLDDLNHVRRPW